MAPTVATAPILTCSVRSLQRGSTSHPRLQCLISSWLYWSQPYSNNYTLFGCCWLGPNIIIIIVPALVNLLTVTTPHRHSQFLSSIVSTHPEVRRKNNSTIQGTRSAFPTLLWIYLLHTVPRDSYLTEYPEFFGTPSRTAQHRHREHMVEEWPKH